MAWLRQLLDWQRETEDPGEFLDSLRFDLGASQVFVFTPKGDVIALPQGATPVDFAYAVHTEVGHRCVGARVNGKLVPLESALDNGDVVEVFTSKAHGAGPSAGTGCTFVKSARARNKIRAWFSKERREEAVEQGKDALARAMRKQGLPLQRLLSGEPLLDDRARRCGYTDITALYAAIGEGHVSRAVRRPAARASRSAARRARPRTSPRPSQPTRRRAAPAAARRATRASWSRASSDVWVKLARCCTPVPGDPIVGFVTRGNGVSVHRADCVNVASLDAAAGPAWSRSSGRPSSTSVFLVADPGRGARPGAAAVGRHPGAVRPARQHPVGVGHAPPATGSRCPASPSRWATRSTSAAVLRAVRGVEGVYDVYRVTARLAADR